MSRHQKYPLKIIDTEGITDTDISQTLVRFIVFKTYLCSSNRYKNLIKIKINISLLYACILMQCIEETGGRTERHRQAGTDIIPSIPYVNGGTLLFSASSNYRKAVN